MRSQIVYILILNIILAFPDCEYGNPEWEIEFETVPFENEFSATISAAQVFIDGVEQTGGKLAAFGEDGVISALDSDGSAYFPPADKYVYELSIWSNQVVGELMTFKFYDENNEFVIDLNQEYLFTSNDIIGDAFTPYELTGTISDCDFQDESHFSDVVDQTGVSMLIILSNTITNLDAGDQIGIFDYNGLLSSGEECDDLIGEVLVGAGEWNQEQLEIAAVSHIDYCDFNGPQFPGFIENNPIKLKVWDISELSEYEAFFTVSSGGINFQETFFVEINEICNIENLPENACDCNGNIIDSCGICGGNGNDYDNDGICDDEDDCIGEYDQCGVCNGDNLTCVGCTDSAACNYDSSALIEGECFYNESQLMNPFNNENIEILDFDNNLTFIWSDIDESCQVENYILNIYNISEELIYSNSYNQNNALVPFLELEIIEDQINSYLWNITVNDNIVSDTFTFNIDATMLNISNQNNSYNISKNFPNPFNPITCIEFEIFSSDNIVITIYDINGNIVKNLVNGFYNPGQYKVYWNAKNHSSGIYFYDISISNRIIRNKMMLMK